MTAWSRQWPWSTARPSLPAASTPTGQRFRRGSTPPHCQLLATARRTTHATSPGCDSDVRELEPHRSHHQATPASLFPDGVFFCPAPITDTEWHRGGRSGSTAGRLWGDQSNALLDDPLHGRTFLTEAVPNGRDEARAPPAAVTNLADLRVHTRQDLDHTSDPRYKRVRQPLGCCHQLWQPPVFPQPAI